MLSELIVVTDLDATLLDHQTYSFSAAQPAISRLQALHIPLILNSSKTTLEMLQIREILNNKHPFIVENGSAVIFPGGNKFKEHSLGMNRAEILAIIHNLREQYAFDFIGFADMDHEKLMTCTGLSKESATLALQRQFTEPLLWLDSEQQFSLFADKLKRAGLGLIKGGRFWHVSGTADKGKALNYLRDYYQKQTGLAPIILALGDSENDLAMLKAADYAVLVKSPVRDFPELDHKNLRKTNKIGPLGWNKAVLEVLEELELA
jgi:mannosyl-3-phosphoglycerate phosphatase